MTSLEEGARVFQTKSTIIACTYMYMYEVFVAAEIKK